MGKKTNKKANRGMKAAWPGMESADGPLNSELLAWIYQLQSYYVSVPRHLPGRWILTISPAERCQKLPQDFQAKVVSFLAFVKKEITAHDVTADCIINMDEVPLTFNRLMKRNIIGRKTWRVRPLGCLQLFSSHFTVVLACCGDGMKLTPGQKLNSHPPLSWL